MTPERKKELREKMGPKPYGELGAELDECLDYIDRLEHGTQVLGSKYTMGLEAKLAKAKEALEYYADQSVYLNSYRGATARKALKELHDHTKPQQK